MFHFPDKMLKIFRDEELQSSFERDGFVIVPYYSQEEIEELISVYEKLHPHNERGFFPSTFSNDKEYRTVVDAEIRRIGQKYIDQYCENIRIITGSFIVKNPSPESGMCVHQDMSLVDESRFTGINIWVPLVDLSIENGAIFVLPGSHRLFPTYRGSSIPEFFSPVMDEIIDYLHPVVIKAGQAVFFDQSIIHFSPPNFSDNKRIVTNTYITHKDAEFRTYFWDGKTDGRLEVFEQDKDFMLNFEQFGQNIHDRPKVGKSLGLVEYNFPKIDVAFLEKHYEKTNARKLIQDASPKMQEQEVQETNQGWFKKLIKAFSS